MPEVPFRLMRRLLLLVVVVVVDVRQQPSTAAAFVSKPLRYQPSVRPSFYHDHDTSSVGSFRGSITSSSSSLVPLSVATTSSGSTLVVNGGEGDMTHQSHSTNAYNNRKKLSKFQSTLVRGV
jgi:hypothetical protein